MTLTRRHFIESGSLSLLAATALPRLFAENSQFSSEDLAVLESVSEQTFKRLIGEIFTVSLDGSSRGSLALIAVTPAASSPPVPKARMVGTVPVPSSQAIAGFSLRFQGSGAALQQDTYTLHNDSIGTFPLFLVPGGSGVKPDTYTAVFNLLSRS